MSTDDQPATYSPTEAARLLGVDLERMHELLATGEIEGWQEDEGWVIGRAALIEYFDRGV